MKNILAIFFFFYIVSSFAQDRVEQGVVYQAGEKVYGPVAGLSSVIPNQWMGIVPQGTEAFLLIPSDDSNAQIVVLVVKDKIEEIRKRWQNKTEFSNGIFLEVEGEATDRNGWLSADINITGSTSSPKGFAEAKCGDWGVCAISLLIAKEDKIDQYKNALISFSDSCVFTEPSLASKYDKFDWVPYLQNKTLIRWSKDPDFKQNNQVNLCKDGKFQSQLKTSGIVKDERSPYLGKNYGEWEVQGTGPTAKLYLYFNKLSPLIVDLEMKDDGKLFINKIQYFSMVSDKCVD